MCGGYFLDILSPDLNPKEPRGDVMEQDIHIMNVQPTNLQLCDAILSIWMNVTQECFRHLIESMPRRIKTAQKAK